MSYSVLVLSSIPIHLLFNSAVFRTEYRGADFHLTIATEDFIKGAAYFPPGASLFFPGVYPELYWPKDSFCMPATWDSLVYGFPVKLSDYDDENSLVLRNISTTARDATQWTKFDANACNKAYTSCQGLSEFGNVVLVVKKQGGWVRDDMWKLRSNNRRFWDRYIPPDQQNHLFFDARCSVRSLDNSNTGSDCLNSCQNALGLRRRNRNDFLDWKNYSFVNITWLEILSDLSDPVSYTASELRPSALDLSIDYCLVQPIETTCRTLSPPRSLNFGLPCSQDLCKLSNNDAGQ